MSIRGEEHFMFAWLTGVFSYSWIWGVWLRAPSQEEVLTSEVRFLRLKLICSSGVIGSHSRLKICRLRSCRFDSGLEHHVWSVRLSVMTQAFHACKRGSIPLRSTKFFRRIADVLRILKQPSRVGVLELVFGCVGKLVTPADCKSAAPGTTCSTQVTSTKCKIVVFASCR